MKVNLKKLVQDKEMLKSLQGEDIDHYLKQKLNKVIEFYDEIERDLEMVGKCIVELDKPRLESIEERDKFLIFLKTNDDI